MIQELFTPKQLKPTKMRKQETQLIEYLKANKIPYQVEQQTGKIIVEPPNTTPIKGKFCVAYYCQSQVDKNQPDYKIMLKTGEHVKYVWTRDEAQKCISDFEKS
jgi:hypothetical protein